MCYWVGTKNVRDEMLRRLERNPEDEIAQLFYKTFFGQSNLNFMEHYVAIGKAKPVLSAMIFEENGKVAYRNMQWSMPWQYNDPNSEVTIARELVNSTVEKAFFVHKEIIFSKRCVIPIDGYWEFFHFNKDVYPYFLHPVEGLFYAAGVWDEEVDEETEETMGSFSILTVPPNPMANRLHNNPKAPNGPRMLLLLPAEKVADYLDPAAGKDDLMRLFKPLPEKQMKAYPTPRFLKREFQDKLNTPAVREKIDYPELFFA
jgi:putative SOS response-associated peptidase YedK